MKHKLFFIILDGASDMPIPALENKTPLESAKIPILNKLAEKGKLGLVDVVGGIAPESDIAVVTLLGYEPEKYYTGRGPLEAVGIGAEFEDGMLALRCNFATSSDGINILDRRAGRKLEITEAKSLALAINKKVKLRDADFIFIPTVEHRAVLVFASKIELSNKITNTDPAYSNLKGVPEALHKFEMKVQECKSLENSQSARLSASLVNEFTKKCYQALKNHPVNKAREKKGLMPANIVLSRDAGNKVPKFYDINERYNKKWAILADMPLEVGIGKLAGMKIIKMPLPTFTKKDYTIRVNSLLKNLNKFDCFYIHIKGPDLYGHDGRFKEKIKCFEEIDKYFFAPLIKKLKSDFLLAVTADHCTPCILKAHSGDPVPLLVYGNKIKSDNLKGFNEKECGKGSIGLIKGKDLMGYLFYLLL